MEKNCKLDKRTSKAGATLSNDKSSQREKREASQVLNQHKEKQHKK